MEKKKKEKPVATLPGSSDTSGI
jgi:serine/threonine protein kinase